MPSQTEAQTDVLIEGGTVLTHRGAAVLRFGADGLLTKAAPASTESGNGQGGPATLGLVDLQVNGFAGVDFNRPDLTASSLDHALESMLRTGVTRCLPTVITGAADHLIACLTALDGAVAGSRLGPLMVAGFHLEGPFISAEPGYIGCHPPHHACLPDLGLFDRLQEAAGGRIRLVTLAPELSGAIDLIRHLVRRDVAVALGHTAAPRAAIAAGVEAGACLSTHLGNATAPVLPKADNVIVRQLAEDRLSASFIADGIHLTPDLLRIYARAKMPARTLLVSDAMAAAAAPAGRYSLGDLTVERRADGSARLPSGALAGSTLTMAEAVRNARAWLGCDWQESVRLARSRALSLLGLEAMPQPGAPAELVAWSGAGDDLAVVAARVGNVVVQNPGRGPAGTARSGPGLL